MNAVPGLFIHYPMLCKVPHLFAACWQSFLFSILSQCNGCCWNSPTLFVSQEELRGLTLLIIWKLNSGGSKFKWIVATTACRHEVMFVNEGICSTYKEILHSAHFVSFAYSSVDARNLCSSVATSTCYTNLVSFLQETFQRNMDCVSLWPSCT